MKELLTPSDAARILKLAPATVRDLARRGVLRVAVLTERGNRLFRREDVEALERTRREIGMTPLRARR